MMRCKLSYGLFDGCLFVATVVKSAPMGQCGLFVINFPSHLELAEAKKKAMKIPT